MTASSAPRRRRSRTSASRPTTSATPTRGSARPSRWPSTVRPSRRRSSRAPAPRPTRSSRRSSTATARAPARTARSTSDAANALLDEAGFDRSQPVDLWFNSGAGHDAWMEAVGNQLRENLGVEFVLQGNLEFAEYLPLGESKGWTGPYRYGWSFDYPSADSYLTPLFTPSAQPPAGSNYAFYDNPEVDRPRLRRATRLTARRTPSTLYQEAEDLLAEDMPMAPLFFTRDPVRDVGERRERHPRPLPADPHRGRHRRRLIHDHQHHRTTRRGRCPTGTVAPGGACTPHGAGTPPGARWTKS